MAADAQNNENSEKLVDQIIEKVKKLNVDQQQFVLRQLQKFEFLERREFQRFRCDNLYVGFDVDGSVTRELVLDISEGGIFVKFSETLPVGQKISLTFADMDGRTQYRINSTVIRKIGNGAALVFDGDNAQQRLKIKTIMHTVSQIGYLIDE